MSVVKTIKEALADNNIRKIHFIFLDALDIDPTFDEYQEAFEACKESGKVFEDHEELIPLTTACCNQAYWEQLKEDLSKNFSLQRYEHMIKVAKVVYADKIKNIELERQNQQEMHHESSEDSRQQIIYGPVIPEDLKETIAGEPYDPETEFRKSQEKLARQNRETEAKQKAEQEALERTREELAAANARGIPPKKGFGIPILIGMIILIILAIILVDP